MYLTIKAPNKKYFLNFCKKIDITNGNIKDIIFNKTKIDGLEITLYNNLTFFFNGVINDEMKTIIKDTLIDTNLYFGIDEVGVGENIGPLIVCGFSFKSVEHKKNSIFLGIKDSKTLEKEKINKIAEELPKYGNYYCVNLKPEKVNLYWEKYNNIKKVNALIQNNIVLKRGNNFKVVIDEFVSKRKFEEYILSENQQVNIKDAIFEKKSEDKFLEVACAAIIAKSLHNKWIENFKKEYNLSSLSKKESNSNYIYKLHKENKIKIKEKDLKSWAIEK